MRLIRTTAIAAAALAASLTLAGCVFLPRDPGWEPTYASSSPETTTPAAPTAVDVSGTASTLTGSQVSTACFDFTTPEIGAEWVLHPSAGECMADVNWPESDQLTMVVVRSHTGDTSAASVEKAVVDSGSTVVATSETTVDGQRTHVVDAQDALGLTRRFYVIELPHGRFEADGTPLTGVHISGYVYDGVMEDILDELVRSFTLH